MNTRNRQLIAGAMLVAAEFVAITFPARLQAVVEFVGGSYQVVLPWGVCVAIAAYALAMRRLSSRSPGTDVAARAVAIGIAVHLILLLTDYARDLTSPSIYTTRAYWIYARIFCGASLALLIAWINQVRVGAVLTALESRVLALPIVLATSWYAVALLRTDSLAFLAGVAIGAMLMAGVWRLAVDRLPARWKERDRLFLPAVFLIALVLRLFYTSRVMTNPDYIETGGDGRFYEQTALSFMQGHGPGEWANGYPLYLLGYPRFIALVYKIAGPSYFAVCAIQALLGAATCLLVYAIARPVFGRPVARVTAVFTAISFQLVFTAATYSHEALDLFLTPLVVWLLILAVTRGAGAATWVIVGLVFGAGIAVRETHAIFLLAALAWILWTLGPDHRVRRTLVAWSWLGLGLASVLLPLIVPKIATAPDRLVLREHLDRLWINPLTAQPATRTLVSPFSSPARAWQQLREEPLLVAQTVVSGVAVNFATQFFTQPYGGFDLVSLTKHSAYYYGIWFWAYVLTAIGLALCIGRWSRGDPHRAAIALIVVLIAARTAPHLILESHYRHRAPIESFLIMMAAVGAVRLVGGPRRAGDEVARS